VFVWVCVVVVVVVVVVVAVMMVAAFQYALSGAKAGATVEQMLVAAGFVAAREDFSMRISPGFPRYLFCSIVKVHACIYLRYDLKVSPFFVGGCQQMNMHADYNDSKRHLEHVHRHANAARTSFASKVGYQDVTETNLL
jgi:hypothetical protein